jgi:hypothetical protein
VVAREGKSVAGACARILNLVVALSLVGLSSLLGVTIFAHLKRILRLDRLRLRGPLGARDEFLLAATAQNLRKLAKLIPIPALQPA